MTSVAKPFSRFICDTDASCILQGAVMSAKASCGHVTNRCYVVAILPDSVR